MLSKSLCLQLWRRGGQKGVGPSGAKVPSGVNFKAMIDLEAIRKRLEEVKRCSCGGCVDPDDGGRCSSEGEIVEDARRLLAEVERLRMIAPTTREIVEVNGWWTVKT